MNRRPERFALFLAALVVALMAALHVGVVGRTWQAWWWWFEVHTGTVNEPGPYYGFWSGFGSFVPLLVPLSVWYWQHTCHVSLCFRPGLHPLAGGHMKACRKHHPAVPTKGRITPAHLLAHHLAHGGLVHDAESGLHYKPEEKVEAES